MKIHHPSRSAGLLLVASIMLLGACVKSYRSAPTLEFSQLPYRSLVGKTWPQHRYRLKKVSKTYRMKSQPEICYVELNPRGAQTLVFIHGLGSYLKFWRYQLDHFAAQGYRVIAVDLPGYGKSDKPASFPYTMEAMADTVRELLGHLGVQRPVLIGHSMGGQTALSYAIRYPREPRAVVLTSPAGFETFSPRERAWFLKVMTTRFVKSAGEYAIWGSVRHGNFYRWRSDYEWLVEERVRLKKAKQFEQYAYANVRSVAGLANNNFVRQSAAKIVAPTLIIFGEKDRLIPNPFMHGGFTRDVMQSGAEKIRGSKLVGLPRCGHTVQIDCHEEYNRTLARFVGKVAPSAGPKPRAVAPKPATPKAAAPQRARPPSAAPAAAPASAPASAPSAAPTSQPRP